MEARALCSWGLSHFSIRLEVTALFTVTHLWRIYWCVIFNDCWKKNHAGHSARVPFADNIAGKKSKWSSSNTKSLSIFDLVPYDGWQISTLCHIHCIYCTCSTLQPTSNWFPFVFLSRTHYVMGEAFCISYIQCFIRHRAVIIRPIMKTSSSHNLKQSNMFSR